MWASCRSGQRAPIFGSIGDQHQRRRPGDHRKEPSQHRLAYLVDPVRVLDNKDRRFGAGQRRRIDQRRQPPPPRIRGDLRQLHIGVGDAQQVIDQQQILGVCLGNAVAHPIASGLPVKPLDAVDHAQQPCHDMERDLAGVRLAEGGEYVGATATRQHRHVAHQAALADAG